MIINPIIPIWLMFIICIFFSILILYNKPTNKKENNTKKSKHNIVIIDKCIKISIVILLFAINLRFMIPNGESTIINSDINILFVIDTSVSMRALDYNGSQERFEGVVNDCCSIVDELSSCKFSIITFGDTAQRIIPFTSDTDMVQAELRAIKLVDDFYATGTSINLVKEIMEETLKKENERQNGSSECVVFFISDGEITKEGEILESFSNMSKYIYNGSVMGYGTTEGGKMISSIYADDPSSPFYYVYYYDEHFNQVTAISKLDENNLKSIASDLKIDYIQMKNISNLNSKLSDIKQHILDSQTDEQKMSSYQDIYYYFAIPLTALLIIHFAILKRRIG